MGPALLLEIQGVDILGAGVFQEERGIIGCQGQGSAVASGGGKVLHVRDLFHFVIRDVNTNYRFFSAVVEQVDGLSVMGPVEPAEGSGGELGPLLRLRVEEEKSFRIGGEGRDEASVGGVPRRVEAIGCGQRGNVLRGEIEDAN